MVDSEIDASEQKAGAKPEAGVNKPEAGADAGASQPETGAETEASQPETEPEPRYTKPQKAYAAMSASSYAGALFHRSCPDCSSPMLAALPSLRLGDSERPNVARAEFAGSRSA
jgi:hypothetical protein